jgi:hypothetical protein
MAVVVQNGVILAHLVQAACVVDWSAPIRKATPATGSAAPCGSSSSNITNALYARSRTTLRSALPETSIHDSLAVQAAANKMLAVPLHTDDSSCHS